MAIVEDKLIERIIDEYERDRRKSGMKRSTAMEYDRAICRLLVPA